jgi:serine/threonine protein phosphatase 1
MHVTEQTFEIGFSCDPGDELLSIGDIHGYAELLDALLDRAEAIPRVPGLDRKIILTGDLIDRGSQSLRCLDLAIAAAERLDSEVIGLLGNHEQFLRIALEEIDEISDLAAGNWIRNGGGAVIEELLAIHPGNGLDVPAALGPARLAWLKSLRSHFLSGQVIAVHAGLNPSTPLAEFLAQPWLVNFRGFKESAHWAWVREPFLDHVPKNGEGHHGLFVVHGHTVPNDDTVPVADQIRRARINLDAGSYKTGRARMVRIVGNQATLFEAVA